ncbi:peptidoglycan-binding domain-containing protein [Yoonia vestfoldensis]|uniref:Putative peptidoglycan binding domain protein n=1 Tax=Yoonia vestfoldensis TaxID=245188 RepID=A0A1Y0EFQ4_9RHOB|nr:peptidoglycan-binding domain-containing protein [Yoonia vestfoldensis]ARU02445.1 putative peptidoglycan binding domain protein [Yoonia vestfoldensis]
MTKLYTLTASLMISTCLAGNALAQESSALDAEIAAIESQISEVDGTIARYDGGLIRILAESRREALLLLRTVVEARQEAEAAGATIEVTVPAVEPDPERAEQLLGEMAAQQLRVEAAEREAASAGGLIQAVALSRVETEKLSLAQLQMAYLQARYGIAFPVTPNATMSAPSRPDTEEPATTAGSDAVIDTALPWADPDHPSVDYSLAPFEQAHNEGDQIAGWWVINEERAAIDDSPSVLAINYSAYDAGSFGGVTALLAQCRESVTSIVFIQDDFVMTATRRDSFDITYRIDDAPAQSTRWSELTNNKGAGLFGTGSEGFMRDLYDADNFFIRLTDGNGQRHDAEFDLAGVQEAIEAVAGACGWSTLDLSRDDYRAIQTMLNAGGFDAGTPDGVWGNGSRNAMRAFQEQNGLAPTGAPDRATLEALGVPTSE